MKPTYFDMTVSNAGEAREFFGTVLGWKFEKFPMPYEYYRIHAGPEDEAGIDGGIGEIRDAPVSGGKPLTVVTVPVPDIEKCLLAVRSSGGRVVENKQEIPGIGWYATCAEPGGLLFGVLELSRPGNRH